jgi:dihydroorotate dehydrogenase (fumarate)
MDLTTTYMGMKLKNPLVVAASPLSENIDIVRKLADAGAAAVVMYSLFEEQINHEIEELDYFLSQGTESFGEALSYFPQPQEYKNLHAEEYLEQVKKLKAAVDIPIIGSLNGVSPGGWIKYAKNIEEAGADALELNIYYMATDPNKSSGDVEQAYLDSVKTVKQAVNIPVAVKVGPYFSAFANMAMKLDAAGADGLVLFNRFYQPDLDIEALEVVSNLQFSSRYEMRLPLRWIAVLYGKVKASLAATSGVHTPDDAMKVLMAGADVVQMASVLYQEGPNWIAEMKKGIVGWMERKKFASVEEFKGCMSYKSLKEPAAYERANYIKMLNSFR